MEKYKKLSKKTKITKNGMEQNDPCPIYENMELDMPQTKTPKQIMLEELKNIRLQLRIEVESKTIESKSQRNDFNVKSSWERDIL